MSVNLQVSRVWLHPEYKGSDTLELGPKIIKSSRGFLCTLVFKEKFFRGNANLKTEKLGLLVYTLRF